MKKILYFTLIIIILFSSIALANDLKTHFINVGQGDATFIELPNNKTILIDAGNNGDGDTIINYIKSQGFNVINYLIGTHPHADHIGGLDYIINNIKVKNFYMPKVTHTTKTFEDVLLAAKNNNIPIKEARAVRNLIDHQNLKVNIIGPVKDNYDNLNNWSAITKITYKNTSFLFTGDAESEVEHDLIDNETNLKANVYKIAHHGSASSNTALFLNKIKPEYGIISVGKDNSYGHPDSIILNRLKLHKIKIFRTDKQGTIVATSNGKNISFNTVAVNNIKQSNPSNNSSKVKIKSVDRSSEIVTIKNETDRQINLSGWELLSVKGKQSFTFPSIVLEPDEFIKIASGRNAEEVKNAIVWTKAYIWNNDGDPAKLFNKKGVLVSSF